MPVSNEALATRFCAGTERGATMARVVRRHNKRNIVAVYVVQENRTLKPFYG